jgi:hypothetical protein
LQQHGCPVYIIQISWYKSWMDFLDDGQHHPGPVMAERILQEQELLLDSEIVKKYTNIQLRENLVENEDYIVVSSMMWRFLYEIYGGFEIQRYIISEHTDDDDVKYEIYLRCISVVMDRKEYTLQISKQEFVKDLKKKIMRIFKKADVRFFAIKDYERNKEESLSLK